MQATVWSPGGEDPAEKENGNPLLAFLLDGYKFMWPPEVDMTIPNNSNIYWPVVFSNNYPNGYSFHSGKAEKHPIALLNSESLPNPAVGLCFSHVTKH